MAIDFSLLDVKRERIADARTAGGSPRRGFARVRLLDCKPFDDHDRYYDLRGGVATARQFALYCKREYGYLRYETFCA